MPRAGQLRDSVIIERMGEDSTDDWGNPVSGSFATLIAAQPARITPMGGDEQVRADRLTGSVKFEITLRHSSANAGIIAGDRIKLARSSASLPSGALLNIRHAPIDKTERRRELTLIVESGVAT